MAVKVRGVANTSSYTSTGAQKDVLEASAKIVDVHMQEDNSYQDLTESLKMGGVSLPSVSGLNDHDYPGQTELGISFESLSELSTVKRLPLPSELVEQFGLMQSNCQMGLFPEICRAWLTIDSNIFIWSFDDGSDLAYYDELNETILCVGLVSPKRGVFQDFIHYLLCLTTPVEIVVLGVRFTRKNENILFEEMNLLPEPLFTYPTDNVHMCAFQGTNDGRIFFGGKDGAIYEFAYQAQDRWFSRKCRKINHSSSALSFLVPSFISLAFSEDDAVLQVAVDNSRHILYARFEKGSLQVFDLGRGGDEMSKVTVLHQQAIVQQACEAARTIDRKNFYPIVHISAVEATESRFVHLIAVTQTGVRLYFTTNGNFGDSRPYTLALLHVRLPPGFTANSAVARPSDVHMAYYRKGFLMLASYQSDDNDIVFATSNDAFGFYPQLIETHSTMMLDGHAWAVAEIPERYHFVSPIKITEIVTDPPALVTQHRDVPRKFVFLSAQGSIVLRKPRPVDQLYKLLVDNKGPDSEYVKAFFMIHKEAQACAMCLILACSYDLQEKQIADWATRAFFIYGGEPLYPVIQHGDVPPQSSESDYLSRPSSPLTPVWSSTPQNPQQGEPSTPHFSQLYSPVKSFSPLSPQNGLNQSILSQQLSGPNVTSAQPSEIIYSGKHNGLYLYFSRIMRLLWNRKLVTEASTFGKAPNTVFIVSSVTSLDLADFLQQLLALKMFIQNNQPAFLNPAVASLAKNIGSSRLLSKGTQSTPGELSSAALQQQRKTQSDAELQERISLSNFHQLVNYTYEMLALWKILCDHHFHTIVTFLSQEQQDLLKVMTFRDFIIDGRELSAGLTNALINFYLEDNASTGTISQRLRELCPSIYRVEDATVSKAHEIVLNSRTVTNKVDKEQALMEALKLCKTVSPNLDLGLMCNLFRSASFYHGIIDLCLCTARCKDPQGLALHFYKNGEPPDDLQGMHAFANRMKCYKFIINTISDLMSQGMSHPQSPSVPKVPGPPPPRDPNVLTPEEAKAYSDQIFEMSLKSDDELFHVALYDWLIEKNQTDILLFIKSHFLENYLKRCASLRPDNSYVMDLLWKYYEKNQNFSAAAKVLSKLADKQGTDMNLTQRMEYLSRAIMCVKSSETRISVSGEGEFLHELEEKMEVARIQLRILEVLQQQKTAPPEAINKLNSHFYDITMLYEEFADRYDLFECKLALVHCSGVYNPILIESLWQNILEKEFVATVGNLPDARIEQLQHKISLICQAYVSSEKYFPLSFIVKFLELKTCAWDFDSAWIFQMMLSLGVSVVELLAVYHKLYKAKDSCWTTCGRPLHLLTVLVMIIGHYAGSPVIVPLNERRSFTTYCLDVVSAYLVDLQAMDTTLPNVPTLIRDFKSVQRKLERLP